VSVAIVIGLLESAIISRMAKRCGKVPAQAMSTLLDVTRLPQDEFDMVISWMVREQLHYASELNRRSH